MKKHFLIVLLLAVVACDKTADSNVELLSKREMVDILIDIHILEAKVNRLRLKTDSAKAVYNSLEDDLFEEFNIQKTVYERSYQYYMVNTKEMQEIYNVVVDSLNLRHQRATLENEQMDTDIRKTKEKPKLVKPQASSGFTRSKKGQIKKALIDSSKVN